MPIGYLFTIFINSIFRLCSFQKLFSEKKQLIFNEDFLKIFLQLSANSFIYKTTVRISIQI